MEKQLVSFETAVLAKEKGFNVHCRHHYCKTSDEKGLHECYENEDFPYNSSSSCLFAPTQALLQEWLFEKHNIWVNIQPDYGNTWWFCLNKFEIESDEKQYEGTIIGRNSYPCGQYLTPFIALEEGLKLALTKIITE